MTKKIRNVSPSERQIAATGDVVPAGGTVEVPADLAKSLTAQTDVWATVRTTKTKQED